MPGKFDPSCGRRRMKLTAVVGMQGIKPRFMGSNLVLNQTNFALTWDFHFDLPDGSSYTPKTLPGIPDCFPRPIFQFARPLNPLRVDIQPTGTIVPKHFPGHRSPLVSFAGPLCANRRASPCGHGERPDPPEHHSEQPSRQVALGQQQPEIPRMLHQPPTRLHQTLLQARQRPSVNLLRQLSTRKTS